MSLVQQGPTIGNFRLDGTLPVEVILDDHALAHHPMAITIIQSVIPHQGTIQLFGIGIKQQFLFVKQQALIRVIRATQPIPVHLANLDAFDVTEPVLPLALTQRHPGNLLFVCIKKTDCNPFRIGSPD